MSTKYTKRTNNRLTGYDYSQVGHYYVTICTKNRQKLFGMVQDSRMIMNDCGNTVNACLQNIPKKYTDLQLDTHIIMPNHVHCIINIKNNVGAVHEPPDNKRTIHELSLQDRRKMMLPKIIGYVKMRSAKQINILCDTPDRPLWQRSFYDHIIRNEISLHKIREYIINNPLTWQFDIENKI